MPDLVNAEKETKLLTSLSMSDARREVLRGLLFARVVEVATDAMKNGTDMKSIGAVSQCAVDDVTREVEGGLVGRIAINQDEVSALTTTLVETKESASVFLALCDLIHASFLASEQLIDDGQLREEMWKSSIPSLRVGEKARMDYKGRVFYGRLESNGCIVVDGVTYRSLSDAAAKMADTTFKGGSAPPLNGRFYWKVKVDGVWTPICNLDKA